MFIPRETISYIRRGSEVCRLLIMVLKNKHMSNRPNKFSKNITPFRQKSKLEKQHYSYVRIHPQLPNERGTLTYSDSRTGIRESFKVTSNILMISCS